MSQQKTLTNIEKGKALRDLRESIGMTQVQMGEALGLHSTYLSQLEKGHRPVSTYNLNKAQRIKEDFEKSKNVKEPKTPYRGNGDVRSDCHLYLERVLNNCQADERRLAWVYVELQRRFPLASSTVAAAAQDILDEAVQAGGHGDRELPHSHEADEPSARTFQPGSYALKRTTGKPDAPKPAPK